MVYLPLSQTHGFSVLYVIYLTTCLVCHWQNGGEPFLPFTSLNTPLPLLSQQDHNFESSFVKRLDLCLHSQSPHQWGSRAFGCKMIVFPTSVTPNSITIGTYPGVRSGARLLSSPWDRPTIVSVSTSTSSIVFISISTLTSVPKSPLGILSVI